MVFIASLTVAASEARAQSPGVGPGIKVSDSLVMHPGVSVGAGYDSNFYYASGVSVDRLNPTFYLAVRPGVTIATRPAARGGDTPHSLDFSFYAGAPLRFPLSGNSVINQHYSIGVDAGLMLAINPFGEWSLDLFDNFLRTSEPPYSVISPSTRNIDRDNNLAGLRLRWRPGGQRFETTLQYTFGLNYFEHDLIVDTTQLPATVTTKNSLVNDFHLRFKWNFFPKTALYLDASDQPNSYIKSGVNTPPSAYPLRIVLGMLGLISAKFEVHVNIGYGNSFTGTNIAYPDPITKMTTGLSSVGYNNAIGLAEFTWKPASFTVLNLGYRHDFAQSLIGTFYDLDGAWASVSQAIWKFNLSLRFGYEHRGFHGDLSKDGVINANLTDMGGVNRTDHLLIGHAQLDFPIRDWLYASVGYDLNKNYSNCRLNGGGLPCDYFRNDVWLRVSVAY